MIFPLQSAPAALIALTLASNVLADSRLTELGQHHISSHALRRRDLGSSFRRMGSLERSSSLPRSKSEPSQMPKSKSLSAFPGFGRSSSQQSQTSATDSTSSDSSSDLQSKASQSQSDASKSQRKTAQAPNSKNAKSRQSRQSRFFTPSQKRGVSKVTHLAKQLHRGAKQHLRWTRTKAGQHSGKLRKFAYGQLPGVMKKVNGKGLADFRASEAAAEAKPGAKAMAPKDQEKAGWAELEGADKHVNAEQYKKEDDHKAYLAQRGWGGYWGDVYKAGSPWTKGPTPEPSAKDPISEHISEARFNRKQDAKQAKEAARAKKSSQDGPMTQQSAPAGPGINSKASSRPSSRASNPPGHAHTI